MRMLTNNTIRNSNGIMKASATTAVRQFRCRNQAFRDTALASCPNNCNGNGDCDKFSKCHCYKQFEGADCSLRICPAGAAWNDIATATDTAHALATCSNRGICDTNSGQCACQDGFAGAACERLDCSTSCNGFGKCLSMGNLAKYTRDSRSNSYVYESVWDSTKVHGCVCDPQFTGYDCSLRVCPDGDDPLTRSQVNAVQLVRCIANSGSFVLYYQGYPSATIRWNDNAAAVQAALLQIPLLTAVSVTFSQKSGTACQTDTNVIQIQFLQQFGALPPLVPVMDSVMSVNGRITVSADGVTQFVDASGRTFNSVVGTKEADRCANRGVCSTADGTCICFATNGDTYGSSNGYGAAGTRGDCGFITSGSTVSSCPGGIQCSGHGVCTKGTWRCSCSSGWAAGDCSERTCPSGLSWFAYPTTHNVAHNTYTTCSSMGLCDTSTGNCVCRNNFFGAACQYMGCGGGLTTPCNGHGKCMSMAELATNAKVNGEAISITYGNDPNNPLTWDGHRIYGCLCDEGFSGYDCSLRTCPVGDDPGTYLDHNEVQLLRCVASGGTFTLRFRDAVTPPIPFSVTSGQLAEILGRLPTVQKVTVTFSLDGPPPRGTLDTVQPPPPWAPEYGEYNKRLLENPGNNLFVATPQPISWNLINGTQLCNTSGTQIAIISFDKIPGDIPPLRTDNSLLTDIVNFNGLPATGVLTMFTDGQTVSGINSVRGTTEVLECNGRGVCDTVTGDCKCFPGWTSSDGDGNPGNSGDCGYRMDERGIIDTVG